MPKAVNREIAKLSKVPHPRGRKTAQLAKKTIRYENRKKTKQARSIMTNIAAERYLWFKDHLSAVDSVTPEMLQEVIEMYLGRFDDELEQIKIKHGIGGKRSRQHANREDIIKLTQSNEREEYKTCGIEIPDVLHRKQFELLKSWSGELRFLQNFKLTRFSEARLKSLSMKENKMSEKLPERANDESNNLETACME